MQQRYLLKTGDRENAVSKTINLPEEATIHDIDAIYKMAWKEQLKGITIFRYNVKAKQVIKCGVTNTACPI
ncbi:hypothetical protein [Niastella koreensis]|nr:hypothetical protein [Niastella koreensis]